MIEMRDKSQDRDTVIPSQRGKGSSCIPLQYTVIPIQYEHCKDWLLKKHYAKRIPPVTYSFGLYDTGKALHGVCTFGTPCKLMNDGACIFDDLVISTLELNRLVINESHEKNLLSYFVEKCLSLLTRPMCVVSYSDIGENHHGYIYQATNWVYTGVTMQTGGYTYFFDNDWQHPRTTVAKFGTREHSTIISKFPDIEYRKVSRKHRYFRFLGTHKQVKEMKTKLKYSILPYPKGDNKRYDASYEPQTQGMLI